jgi:drug/metabolite transporter (DMT)-like permease
MNLLFLVLFIAPVLFAIAVLLDKKILSYDHEGASAGPQTAVGGIFNLIWALIAGGAVAAGHQAVPWKLAVPLLINGGTYVAAMWLYMKAMKGEEAARVAPVFQLIPAIGLLGDVLILHKVPAGYVIVGIAMIVSGSLILNFRKGKIRWDILILMSGASLLLAINDVVFARFGREMETLPAIFSDLTGKALWGLLFLAGRRNRRGAAMAVRLHFFLLILIEFLTLGAEAIFDVGKLFFPVSTVQAVDCTQDVFMLLGVIVFSKYLPGFLREDIRQTTLWQKIIGILVMVFGGILIATGSG